MMKVLVVDDQEDICEFLRDLLELHGCGVITAFSGEEALKVTKNRLYDAAFIDVCLPGMDGVETMKILRERRPEARYVLMTGANIEDRVDEGIEDGAETCLQKPFHINEILSVIGAFPESGAADSHPG
ncbi:MAG: response regulator [Bacteroidales bacterium]|nr:response regulator [Candidatus Latescibacterota bacterium]